MGPESTIATGIISLVPVLGDPSRPSGRVLADREGAPLGRFVEDTVEGRPVARLFERSVSVERALGPILRELRGWRVAADPELGHELVLAGARHVRYLHVLSRDLVVAPAAGTPAAPPGLQLRALDRPAADLVPAFRSAFAEGHVDGRRDSPLEELEGVLSGATLGPVLSCSGLAVDADANVRAAVIVNDSPLGPPLRGPWIAECFRDRAPAYAGAGRALLERTLALATSAGLETIGLTVTHGNRARQLYESLGFREVRSIYSVDL